MADQDPAERTGSALPVLRVRLIREHVSREPLSVVDPNTHGRRGQAAVHQLRRQRHRHLSARACSSWQGQLRALLGYWS